MAEDLDNVLDSDNAFDPKAFGGHLKGYFQDNACRALSFFDAMALFDRLADRPDIAFGYVRDGCYARAHLMCLEMEAQGLAPLKAWALEYIYKGNPPPVTMPNGKIARWDWHVAPALPVRMAEGDVRMMVFDPGLFDGPVPPEEWARLIHVTSEKIKILPFGAPPLDDNGDYIPDNSSFTHREDILDHARATMEKYLSFQTAPRRTVFASAARKQACDQKPMSFSMQGKTWVSLDATATGPAVSPHLPPCGP